MIATRLRTVLRGARAATAVVAFGAALGIMAGPAQATTIPAAAWKVMPVVNPSAFFANTGKHKEECESPNFAPGRLCDKYYIVLENVGGAPSEAPATITIDLPSGVTLVPNALLAEPEGSASCEEIASHEATCTYPLSVPPAGFAFMRVGVVVEPGTSSPVHSTIAVSGGVASPPPPVEVVTPIAESVGPLGLESFSSEATDSRGLPSTQAGAHPFLFTTALTVTSTIAEFNGPEPREPLKDLVFYLPLGFLGNAKVAARCPASLVEGGGSVSSCPPVTRVGNILPNGIGGISLQSADPTGASGIYNIAPERGVPAEFAFPDSSQQIFMYASVVLHNGQYVLRVAVPGVPGVAQLFSVVASFFGDLTETYGEEGSRIRDVGAFLTNPSDCSANNLSTDVELDTWENPGRVIKGSGVTYPEIKGCDALPFSTSLKLGAQSRLADEATGYRVAINAPEAPNFGSDLAAPPIKRVSVTLPEGVSLAPGGANGLVACQAAGSDGINMTGPESEAPGPEGLDRPAPGHCPGASKVAVVHATTPLLDESLEGSMFLAAPECGTAGLRVCSAQDAEDGALYRAYLELTNPVAGIVIKLVGTFHVNATTGQITAIFDDNPQFPFSELTVSTAGGSGAVLATPQQCGPATTAASIVPWSASAAASELGHQGTPVSTPTDSLQIEGCSSGFAAPLSAGTLDSFGGASSTFALKLDRSDRSPNWTSVTTTLPPGLLAKVSSVPECGVADANAGSCPSASAIGTATVSVGPGSAPYRVTGTVYFTGPYAGAPFGLSIVVPAVAGPFNLGDVVVRAAIDVDRTDAHVVVNTDALPQIRDGVPLRLKEVSLKIDRAGFIQNPTNCAAKQIATVVRAGAAQAPAAVPFAATGCKYLPFAPGLVAKVSGKTSRAFGASLSVKITQHAGEANIGKVELEIPKTLPARLTTLHGACPGAQFAANPAGCPAGSAVGTAVAITPLLKSHLVGPAYLVSHGGAAFPDVVFVLQGEGVTIDVVGHTDIKHGITYSRFETVPDAPITSFETTFPKGPRSLLGSPSSLCGHTVTRSQSVVVKVHRGGRTVRVRRTVTRKVLAPLSMPAHVVGQNGKERRLKIAVAITGCTTPRRKR